MDDHQLYIETIKPSSGSASGADAEVLWEEEQQRFAAHPGESNLWHLPTGRKAKVDRIVRQKWPVPSLCSLYTL